MRNVLAKNLEYIVSLRSSPSLAPSFLGLSRHRTRTADARWGRALGCTERIADWVGGVPTWGVLGSGVQSMKVGETPVTPNS